MAHDSSPRAKARAFVIVGVLLCALIFVMAPAALADAPHPVKVMPHQMSDVASAPSAVTDYGVFDNPNYYYASVKVAPTSVWYRQTSFSPDGMKLVAQKSWTDTASRTEIVLMNADGSNETVISQGDSGTGDIYGYMNPFWSDDGTAVGFAEVHNANPNKIVRYLLAENARSYIYEPVAPLDANNPDFLGTSTTSIVFWDYGVGGNVADLFTWDGSTLTNLTNTADYKEYEPVSNANGSVILYWSGETTAEPVNTTHTLTNVAGTWAKDVAFTPIPDSYWGFWTGKADNHIGLTVMSSKDVHIYSSSGTFVMDLTGPGYSGGSDQWNFFGNEGASGEFVMTSNANRGVVAGRDIVVAAPRSEVWVDDDGSDANPGTKAAPFATIQKGVDTLAAGGTVNVAPGTYAGSIMVNKSATLLGDPGDASPGPGANSPVVDGGSASGDAFRLANGVSNVVIQGFEIRNFTSNDTGIGNGVSAWVGSTSSITIRDNYFHDLGYNAVLVGNDKSSDPNKWGDHTNWTIKSNIVANVAYIGFELTNTSNSIIEGNAIHLSSPDIGAIFSSARRSETGLTIKDNLIDGTPSTAFPVIYIYAYDLDMANPNLDGVLIQGNTIATAGTPYQIYVRNIGTGTVTGVEVHGNNVSTLKNSTSALVDAERNYWGTIAFSEIALKINGSVDWSPWCNSDFTTCTYTWPVHNITQGTDYPTIQAAVDAANPGDAIHVDAGTYAEHVAVNKAVSLVGAAGATIDGGGTGTVVTLSASGATVEGFTIRHSGATAGDAGVLVTSVSGCTVKSNTVTNNANGIALVMASGNFVTSNAVSANAFYGIALAGALNNTIDLNAVIGNGLDAIALDNASAVGGDTTTGSTGNLIKGNTISSSRDGIFLGENCDNNQVTGGNALTNIASIGVNAWRSDGHTITGNAIHGAATGVRLLGSSNNTITGNALTVNDMGIKVDASWQVGVWYQSLNNTISGNDLSGNTTYGVETGTEQTAVVVAENNWWGSACGPAAGYVSANVDFTPWWADAAGSLSLSGTETTITAGMTAAQQSAIINCAAPGATITYVAGSYPGGVIVTANEVIIDLNGATVGAGSPAFTIAADDVTILGPGTLDGNHTDPAVLVQTGADNFTLQDVEVKNWEDGVQVAGPVTSLKIVNNYIHNNDDAGLQVDAAPTTGSVVTIEGNLFKANGGNGIETTVALEAEYNSWGAVGGPATGDDASASVDADPWTFAETYIDVDPTAGDQYTRGVVESVPFDVEVRAQAVNVYGFTFKFAFPTNKLVKNSVTLAPPFVGACQELSDLLENEVGYSCYATTPLNGVHSDLIATINFTAQTSLLTGPGPWTALFDVDPVASTAGTANGAKVYLNNVKLAGVDNGRDITDADDGEITVTGIAQYTGFIDVQGRADDSGAVLEVHAASTVGSDLMATATSAKGGAYTTAYASSKLLTVGTTYYFVVDKPRYLTTKIDAGVYVPGKELALRPLTPLSQLVLKGGDAIDDNVIDVSDAGLIGGAYGTTPVCPLTGNCADVNGDGKVDILDLTLMGGNYGLTYSDWAP